MSLTRAGHDPGGAWVGSIWDGRSTATEIRHVGKRKSLVERGGDVVISEVLTSVDVIRTCREPCPAAGDAAVGLRGKVAAADVHQSMGWRHGSG